jgi:hypothetical protein
MQTIPNYPIIDGHRKHYVRTPVKLDETILKRYQELGVDYITRADLGNFIAVNVLENGYKPVPTPVVFPTEARCQKSCDIHNDFHGWSKADVYQIIYASMGNSINS